MSASTPSGSAEAGATAAGATAAAEAATGATARRRAPARRGQGSVLREDILSAATAMIARSGDVSTLTLRAVAREVGVAATSIYLHFADVEDLVAAVKVRHFDELTRTLTEAAEAAGTDPVARLLAQCRAYVGYGSTHGGEYAVMFTSRLWPAGGSAPTRLTIAADLFEAIVADLRTVRRRDSSPMAEPEARMVAFHLWTALHGMVSLRLLRPLMDWPPADEEVEDLVRRLLGPLRST